ncbi:MAG: T9SS type A sorting domain-containing protein [Chitinophagales bacterium]
MNQFLKAVALWLLIFPNISRIHAQQLSLVHCMDGGRSEILRSFDVLPTREYLLDIRSQSKSGYFESDNMDSLSYYFGTNWLVKLAADGDTLWRKRLAHTERALHTEYFPSWFGSIPFSAFGYPLTDNLYSVLDDEVILHYNFFESIQLESPYGVINDSLRNNILVFGILRSDNGAEMVEPFQIDTLIYIPKDTSVEIGHCFVNKINDSIYQMAVIYSKTHPYAFEYEEWDFKNFYRININSKSVSKQSYSGYDYKVFKTNEYFYLLETTVTGVNLSLLSEEGAIVRTTSLSMANQNPDILDLLTVLDNGNLVLGGVININSSDTTFLYAIVLYTINKDDLTYSVQTFINHTDAQYVSMQISPVMNTVILYPWDFNLSNYPQSEQKSNYFLMIEYISDIDTFYNVKYLYKMNDVTGEIEWSHSIENKEAAYAIELEDGVLLQEYSQNGDGLTMPAYKNVFKKIDPSGNIVWSSALPDTIVIDSIVYFSKELAMPNVKLNYGNKMVFKSDYIDTTNGNSYFNTPFYFILSFSTGHLERIQLPLGFTSNDIYPGAQYLKDINFFNNASDELFILTEQNNQCTDSSMGDIVIYKYRDILSNTTDKSLSSAQDITIYPNPANSVITIRFNGQQARENAFYVIYDLTGKNIASGKLIQQESTVNVANIPGGMYLIQLKSDRTTETRKFQIIK